MDKERAGDERALSDFGVVLTHYSALSRWEPLNACNLRVEALLDVIPMRNRRSSRTVNKNLTEVV